MFIIASNNKIPQSLRNHSCLHLLRWWNWWQLTQVRSEVRHQYSLCWNATVNQTIVGGASVNQTIVGGASVNQTIVGGASVTRTDGSIWVKILVDKKTKNWVDFYHYIVVVYTHCQHTFMFKQLVKVHVALYDPFNIGKKQQQITPKWTKYSCTLPFININLWICIMQISWNTISPFALQNYSMF